MLDFPPIVVPILNKECIDAVLEMRSRNLLHAVDIFELDGVGVSLIDVFLVEYIHSQWVMTSIFGVSFTSTQTMRISLWSRKHIANLL